MTESQPDALITTCDLGHPVLPGTGAHAREQDAALHCSASRDSKNHLRPWEARELCRDLATREVTRAKLGRRYGISASAVTQFAKRNAREIDDIRARLDDPFAGIWIARKENRLAAYAADAEQLPAGAERTAILKAVAEELGQLPARGVAVSGEVRHVLEGVDLGDLT